MKVLINTQATLKSMDLRMDTRARERYLDEAHTTMVERLAEIGAICYRDGECLRVEKKDGRGLLAACRAAAAKACGAYGNVRVM